MSRIWIALAVLSIFGCAEGDTVGTPTGDTDVRPLPDVSWDGGDDAGACVPADEVCDGIDNDCDTTIDEDCACVHGTVEACKTLDPSLDGKGVCAAGTRECEFGEWTVCDGEVLPGDEVCNGLDDNCDGAVDEGFGQETCGMGACEVTQVLCEDGVPKTCVPGTPNPAELCDGLDDDCDGEVDEGCECITGMTQPCYTGAAGTRGVGMCADGVQTCDGSGQWGACEGEVLPEDETCDDQDNDCDGEVDEGNPDGGASCSTGLAGVCGTGSLTCQDGSLACVQTMFASAEICDGLDNDCNPLTNDGSADSRNGMSCDGLDSDLCNEGTLSCVDGAMACSDTTGHNLDVCNGTDDDCDPSSPDGSEDPLVGGACDGPDSDLCQEGLTVCSMGGLSCTDTTGDVADVCDGVDNDCNPATADGSADALVGTACDGPDNDLCQEGTYSCSMGGLVCSDATGDVLDVCDGIDNDCNPATVDGSADPLFGASCDGGDTDLCLEGTYTCSLGSMVCGDTTGSTVETCNGVDDNCDGTKDEGFVRDSNPSCAANTVFLGTIDGDTSDIDLSATAYNERWYRFRLFEGNDWDVYLSSTITLTSAAGTDFDLYVYCESCTGNLAGSSRSTGVDTVNVRRNDSWGNDDSFDVYVEVRHFSSSVCGYWTLTIQGDTTVSTETCP